MASDKGEMIGRVVRQYALGVEKWRYSKLQSNPVITTYVFTTPRL
jgi:hypothetical protein